MTNDEQDDIIEELVATLAVISANVEKLAAEMKVMLEEREARALAHNLHGWDS
jgi:uncharacterized coiled-coil protein SlyX